MATASADLELSLDSPHSICAEVHPFAAYVV